MEQADWVRDISWDFKKEAVESKEYDITFRTEFEMVSREKHIAEEEKEDNEETA